MRSSSRHAQACPNCCPSGNGCPRGFCADDAVITRVGCTGGRQHVTKLTMAGGYATPPGTAAAPSTAYFVPPWGPGMSSAYPFPTPAYPTRVATTSATLTLSNPVAPPDGARGNANPLALDAWTGFRKSITIGENSYTFDGAAGLGVALAFDTTDGVWTEYPVIYILGGGGYPPEPRIDYELNGGESVDMIEDRTDYVVRATPQVGVDGDGIAFPAGVQVTVGANTTRTIARQFGARLVYHDAPETVVGGPYYYAYVETAGVNFNSQPPVAAIANGCEAGTASGTFEFGGTAGGTYTFGYVDPDGVDGVSEAAYGLGMSPCALSITGTLYATFYVEFEGDNREALEPGTLDIRVIRDAPGACRYPGGRWNGGGTLTVGETVYAVSGATLLRIGPRLYQLAGNAEHPTDPDLGRAFEVHFRTSGDGPETIVETEQFKQPHNYSPPWDGDSPHPTSPRALVPMVPSLGWLTANDLAVAEAEPIEGDPACSPCLSATCGTCDDCSGCDETVAVEMPGYLAYNDDTDSYGPLVIFLSRLDEAEGCTYAGGEGSQGAIVFVEGDHFVLRFDDVRPGTFLIYHRPCADGPVGTYTFDSVSEDWSGTTPPTVEVE